MTRNVVIFLPNWIGDTVMATPTLRALRKHFGDEATITGVGKPYVQRVLKGTAWLDQFLPFDRKSPDRELRSWSVAKKLRRLRPDVAIYLSSSLVPALMGWWAGVAQRVGYKNNGRRPLLTIGLQPQDSKQPGTPISTVDHYLQLAFALGCPPESRRLELAVSDEDEHKCEAVWCELGLNDYRNVVLFNCASGNGTSRAWPTEYYVQLAQQIVRTADTAVLILCGPGERDLAAEIEHRAEHPQVRSMVGKDLSLGVANACLRRAQLLVTTDNGPRHLAAAFATPTVVLSGPFDPLQNKNYNPHEVIVRHGLDCQPCNALECPLKHNRCMQELRPEQAYRTVQQVLARQHQHAA